MTVFQWDNNFITGIDEIDKQHKYLVELVNRLGSLLINNNLHYDHVDLILKELIKYAKYHFKEEEQNMTSCSVDTRHTSVHKKLHANFIKDVVEMTKSIDPKNENDFKKVFEFLMHWLTYHILGIDQELARQILQINKGIMPEQAYELEKGKYTDATESLLTSLNSLLEQISEENRKLKEQNGILEDQIKKLML